jgi:hypothetical protein
MQHVAYADEVDEEEVDVDADAEAQSSLVDLLSADPYTLLIEFDDEFTESGIPSWAFTRIYDFIANNNLKFMWQVAEMKIVKMEPYKNKRFAKKARVWVKSWLNHFGLYDGMSDDHPDMIAAKLRTTSP